jgi:hypothetical protein
MDILGATKGEIIQEHVEEVMKGERGFCYEYFSDVMTSAVHLVSGNRSDFKQVEDLRAFLFDFDYGRIRAHWEDRPYRKLYRRAVTGLRMKQNERQVGKRFLEHVWRKLYAFHWLLPYPSAEVFTQTTKEGQRMWYSIVTDQRHERGLQWVDMKEWRWGRKQWQIGEPEAIPNT